MATASAAKSPPKFGIWARGTWARFKNDTTKGDFGLLFVGADYRFNSGVVVGMVASFDWTDEEDAANGFSADGKGWMAGPYIVSRLHQNLIFDGRLAYGKSDNEVSPFQTYTDSYRGTRWMATARFTGDFKFSNVIISPHAGIIYFQEKQEDYVDSLSVAIPSQTVKLGRLTFGPKVSTSFRMKDGTTIAPYVGIKGIWDFKTADRVDLATGLTDGSSKGLRGRVDAGLSTHLANGIRLIGSGFYDGIGVNDFQGYGGRVRVSVPLQGDSGDYASLGETYKTAQAEAQYYANAAGNILQPVISQAAEKGREEVAIRSGIFSDLADFSSGLYNLISDVFQP